MHPRPYTQAPAAHRMVRRLGATPLGARLLARIMPDADRAALRATRGRHTVTQALSGLPICALETTGRRSRLTRTTPVLGVPVGEAIAIAAGNFGSARTPDWCANLRADPNAQIVLNGRHSRVIARELAGAERQSAWDAGLALYPGAAAYARRPRSFTRVGDTPGMIFE